MDLAVTYHKFGHDLGVKWIWSQVGQIRSGRQVDLIATWTKLIWISNGIDRNFASTKWQKQSRSGRNVDQSFAKISGNPPRVNVVV